MRTVTKIETYKLFNELTEEQQDNEVNTYLNYPENMDMLFENNSFAYEDRKQELITKLENKGFNFIENEFQWGSNSQGWYFERFLDDYLTYDYEKTFIDAKYGQIDITAKFSFSHYSKQIMSDCILQDLSSDCANEPDCNDENIIEYENYQLLISQLIDEDLQRILKEGKEIISDFEDLIYKFNSYYPDREEVESWLIDNEIEILTETKEL